MTDREVRFTVTIERLGAGGDGVARVGEANVFVAGCAPGDKVEIEIPQEGPGDRARLIKVIEASSHRVAAACAHFGQCGGCALQHLQTQSLSAWKRNIVLAALRHRGIEATVAETIQIAPGDRRRAVFKAVKQNGRLVLGFNAPNSHKVIDIDHCPLLAGPLNKLIQILRGSLHALLPERGWAKCFATLVQRGAADLAIDASLKGDRSQIERITELLYDLDLVRLVWNGALLGVREKPIVMIDDIPVQVPIKAFLQASRAGERHLIELVRQAVGDAGQVTDLFCGLGTFALPLSKSARLVAYDGAKPSIEALHAAALAGSLPVQAIARDLFRAPLTPEELAGADAVIFDPPRAGAEAQARQIAKSAVPIVIAVSCDPGTFARDARFLIDGGYRLQRVQPVDQFVWSPHIELVARFARSGS